jgi:hypothetical protein
LAHPGVCHSTGVLSGLADMKPTPRCLAPGRVDAPINGGRYRSLFDDLPPIEVDDEALHAFGRPGGPCDLGVDIFEQARRAAT